MKLDKILELEKTAFLRNALKLIKPLSLGKKMTTGVKKMAPVKTFKINKPQPVLGARG